MPDIAPGYYKARAIAGSEQYGTTKNGNDQIALDFDVPDLGRHLSVFFFFTEAGAPYAIEKLRRCGWAGDDPTNLAGVDANEVELSVSYETYQGQQKMKVDVAGGGGKVELKERMDDAGKRQFGARIKALIKGAGGAPPAPTNGARAPAPARAQAPAQKVDDDPIPF